MSQAMIGLQLGLRLSGGHPKSWPCDRRLQYHIPHIYHHILQVMILVITKAYSRSQKVGIWLTVDAKKLEYEDSPVPNQKKRKNKPTSSHIHIPTFLEPTVCLGLPSHGHLCRGLAGVLWYLHHEVVIQAPRKFQITRILRYKAGLGLASVYVLTERWIDRQIDR